MTVRVLDIVCRHVFFRINEFFHYIKEIADAINIMKWSGFAIRLCSERKSVGSLPGKG